MCTLGVLRGVKQLIRKSDQITYFVLLTNKKLLREEKKNNILLAKSHSGIFRCSVNVIS